MNILLIDSGGYLLDYALRCKKAGHTVRWFIGKDKKGLPIITGDGLGLKVRAWEPHMKWADLIFLADNAKFLPNLEPYRRQGYPICGANRETAEWELDRNKGQGIFEKCNISCIESIPFSNYKKARQHVEATMKRYVSKPNGDVDKSLSYVSKNPADMCFMLDYWQEQGKTKAEFILQEFVPGIEMAVGGWFGPGGFSKYFLENFEHKKLMNGDIGVNTGEMGTVMRYVEESLLAEKVLKPLEGELYRQGYTGYIDVAVIIDKKGNPWPLEFTTRPGYPLWQIQQALHKGDPAEWMFDLVNGVDSLRVVEEVATGIVLAIPDFPYNHKTGKDVCGFPVYGINERNSKNIHPFEMHWGCAPAVIKDKVQMQEMLVTSGTTVLVASGTGNSVEKSKEHAYNNFKHIEIPNSPMYRTDIGDRVIKQLPELQDLGYAQEW